MRRNIKYQKRFLVFREKKLDNSVNLGNIRLPLAFFAIFIGGDMGRHNREGKGADQQGFEYQINYQPDWLRLVKVTRTLDSRRPRRT